MNKLPDRALYKGQNMNHNNDYKATFTPMDETNEGTIRCNSGSSNQIHGLGQGGIEYGSIPY